MVATSGRFPEALLQKKKNKKTTKKKMNTGQNHGQPSQAEGKLLRADCQAPPAALALVPAQLCGSTSSGGGAALYVYMKLSPRTDHRPMDSRNLRGWVSLLTGRKGTGLWDSSVLLNRMDQPLH